ncbi:MAG: cob(I)yrinic acid a,c-diamide adenosyltransferase [Lachnospiraceae bacterium]|nr:cob(I)yrinic acid a,c-diamide adenosyltransferase [Lachnospiraceae bacterium]
MDTRIIQAFYGLGKGKTSAAVGQALREVSEGQHITIIQFLKGKIADEFQVLTRLEPDVQIFRFDKSEVNYCDLSLEEKEEEKQNIWNGFNFAKKVIETGESDVVILDELLGLVDLDIIHIEDVKELLQNPGDYRKLIITGSTLAEALIPYIDVICEITLRKDNT